MMKRRVRIKYEIILLFTALGIYMINKIYLKQLTDHWIIQYYLNDIMAGICFSTVSQLLMWFWLKRPIKDAENILLIYLAGSYWEFIAPLYIDSSVADLYDLAAYLAGGIIVILVRKYVNKLEEKR